MVTGLDAGFNRFDNIHGLQASNSYGGTQGQKYPSPFFDIGHTYLPQSVKQLLHWCRFYFLTNPIINSVAYKMAEYPITPIEVEEEDTQFREKWEDVIENKLKLRSFQIEVGLDYNCYGNAFITMHFPFKKYLKCKDCKHTVEIRNATYKFRNFRYYLSCSKCETTAEAKVIDHNIRSLRGIRPIRWNPEYVDIEYNEATGQMDYFFDIPVKLKNDIMMGKKHVVETVPDEFVDALRQRRSIKFREGEVFHLKRPTIAQKDQGWGMPLILPVLKDTYYLQILRKAQEAIAQQHIVPLRVLFPQPGTASSDPYTTTDLGSWRKRIESEIEKWRLDPNYIPVLPLPIGNEVVGGEGRALMLHQEMRAWSEQIVAGMQVPLEFVFGGLQYSGSSVSMRMLENQFLGYRTNLLLLCRDFILKRVAQYMEWEPPKIRFQRFKMADDLQRLALTFQVNQAQKISDTTLLNEMGYDIVQEEKYKRSELSKQLENQRRQQVAAAKLQGELQVIMARSQAEAARYMGTVGAMPTAPQQGAGSGAAGATMDNPGSEQPQMQEVQMPAGGAAPGTQTQQPDQGAQAAPGMPANATAYPENGGDRPQDVPQDIQSPIGGQQQGGYNIIYLARRAASAIKKLDGATQQQELNKLRAFSPQLYQEVLRLMFSGQGSQVDSLDPQQAPLPSSKPPRRQATLI